jgi:AbrB family looped-hinge helix DNA binding protein
MNTTRLSSKGQLVLPKAIREADAWAEGTEFTVERVPEGVLLRPVRSLPPTRLKDVIGCAGYRGAVRSAADMERAIFRSGSVFIAKSVRCEVGQTSPTRIDTRGRRRLKNQSKRLLARRLQWPC